MRIRKPYFSCAPRGGWLAVAWLLLFGCLAQGLHAQYNANQQRRDATAPLPEIELELHKLAYDILHHRSTPHKDSLNRLFVKRLQTVLTRPDSYDYPFANLVTVSRIFPEDQSFRLFTWVFYRFDSLRQPIEARYYGCIQRRLQLENGQQHMQLKLLADVVEPNSDQASFEFYTPQRWLGALYYAPRHSPYGVLTYEGKVRQMDGLTGRTRKQKVKYYVLLGLNQHGIDRNYKLIDVITFDEQDTGVVSFGAPIFYLTSNAVARKRILFEYTDNSPFSLNLGYVLSKRLAGWRRRQLLIVFDHLDQGGQSPQQRRQAAGADGTYDAFYFYNRRMYQNRKGLFYFLRDVAIYEPSLEKYKPRQLRRQARENRKRFRRNTVPYK